MIWCEKRANNLLRPRFEFSRVDILGEFIQTDKAAAKRGSLAFKKFGTAQCYGDIIGVGSPFIHHGRVLRSAPAMIRVNASQQLEFVLCNAQPEFLLKFTDRTLN
jgi:hypothetical protein